MSDSPLRHWSALFSTNPDFTKPFTVPGGFKGTASNPTWGILQITEHFGPMGVGWGTNEPHYTTIGDVGAAEVVVFCVLECWYNDIETGTKASIWGVGGNRVVSKRQTGLFVDDDAFKKAFTDALTNAFSRLGLGADIRMGLYDDVKYIAAVRDHFSNPGPNPLISPTTKKES